MRIPSCPPCILCWLWRIQWARRIHQNTGPALTMQQRPQEINYVLQSRDTKGQQQAESNKTTKSEVGLIYVQPWETPVGLCSRIRAIKTSLRRAARKACKAIRCCTGACVWNWATSAADSVGCWSSRCREKKKKSKQLQRWELTLPGLSAKLGFESSKQHLWEAGCTLGKQQRSR